jgi:predicted dehydrogenase
MTVSSPKRVGLIGLDTSHVMAFTKLLNNADDENHVPGARVVAGFPGGSPDFEASISRVEGFTNELRDDFGLTIMDSPEAVAEAVDMVFINAVDGRVHRELFSRVAPFQKPTFIDKPFTTSVADAETIVQMAADQGVPLMSCSSLRYADPFVEAVADDSDGALLAIDVYGPMSLEPTQPGWFWYGCHSAEMAVAAMGAGLKRVHAYVGDDVDVLTAEWADGRVATLRGMRSGHQRFACTLHREKNAHYADVQGGARPYYAGLLEAILRSLPNGKCDFPAEQMLDVVKLMEAANTSRESGEVVTLA